MSLEGVQPSACALGPASRSPGSLEQNPDRIWGPINHQVSSNSQLNIRLLSWHHQVSSNSQLNIRLLSWHHLSSNSQLNIRLLSWHSWGVSITLWAAKAAEIVPSRWSIGPCVWPTCPKMCVQLRHLNYQASETVATQFWFKNKPNRKYKTLIRQHHQ